MAKKPKKVEILVPETMANYERRIRATLTRDDFAVFHNAWIGTYKVYSCVSEDITDTSHPMYCHAFVLLRIAREHGFNCLGVTSERRKKGVYIASPRIRAYKTKTEVNAEPETVAAEEESEQETIEKVVYVGKFNYFTGKENTKFRMRRTDNVYDEKEEVAEEAEEITET